MIGNVLLVLLVAYTAVAATYTFWGIVIEQELMPRLIQLSGLDVDPWMIENHR